MWAVASSPPGRAGNNGRSTKTDTTAAGGPRNLNNRKSLMFDYTMGVRGGSAPTAAANIPQSVPWNPSDSEFWDSVDRLSAPASTALSEQALLPPQQAKEVQSLRKFFSSNYARMRDEAGLLIDRAGRLNRLGIDPQTDWAAQFRDEVNMVGEKLPWRELSVAVAGHHQSGKSAILSKITGRNGLFGNGVTTLNYAFVHAKNSAAMSPRDSNAQNSGCNLVVVSHSIDRLENITFVDTVAANGGPTQMLGTLQSDTINFSGLNVDDPAVLHLTVNHATVALNQPQDASTHDALSGMLSSEAVDVVVYVVSPEDLSSVLSDKSPVTQVLSSGTLPIFVVNKLDSVWDQFYASSKGDESFMADYGTWKRNTVSDMETHLNVPGSNQFFISAQRESSLNEMEDLDSVLSELAKRRKTIKTFTAIRRLGNLATAYGTVVKQHSEKLEHVDSFVRNLRDTVMVSMQRPDLENIYGGAVMRALHASLRDIGIDDINSVPGIDFEQAQQQDNPYWMARCAELGIGQIPLQTPTSGSGSTSVHISPEIRLRNMVVNLYRKAADLPNGGAMAAAAALRLSHLHRPSSGISSTQWDSIDVGNPTESVRWLRLAAAKGSAAALVELGRALEMGDCLDVDMEAAGRHYSKAADLRDPEGMFAFAKFLESGLGGVSADARRAGELYKDVAEMSGECGFEAALELARLFEAGLIGSGDVAAEVNRWREVAARLWKERCVVALQRVWKILSGQESALKNMAAVRLFLDRLNDQVRMQTALLRSRLCVNLKVNINTVAADPALNNAHFQKLHAFLRSNMVENITMAWSSGNLDEEADVNADPSGEVTHPLASLLQDVLTVASPGSLETATLADAMVAYWISKCDLNAMNQDQNEEVHSIGNDVLGFISKVSSGQPPEEGHPQPTDQLLGLFQSSWRTSIDRLQQQFMKILTPLDEAISRETKIWSRRYHWSQRLANESVQRIMDLKEPVVKALMMAAMKARALNVSDNGVVASGRVKAARAESDVKLDARGLFKMPFVWEGSSMVMSSQLLDEVIGSFPKSVWDWNDNNSIPQFSQAAIKIDELIDKGVIAYTSPSASQIAAVNYWQNALHLAEANGDLIREANALSNIGCASRMTGRLNNSLQYLDLAWKKSCTYIVLASRKYPKAMGISLIRTSLVSDLVNIEANSFTNPGNTDMRRVAGGQSNTDVFCNSDWSFATSPAIVIWFMRLLINLGHANLAVGRVDIAAEWYDACTTLCDQTLVRHPILPQAIQPAPEVIGDGEKKKRPKSTISYLHKATLFSFVRALTHRGVCYATVGNMEEGIRCQMRALDILTKHCSSIGDTEITYRAAIEANLGNIHHMRGRLAAAVSHHARSAMLFLQIDDHYAHARELGNLGALWIEIGKTLRDLEWVRESNPAFMMAVSSQAGRGTDGGGAAAGKTATLKSKRSEKGMRRKTRPLTAKDVALADPGKQYRVAKAYDRGKSDLDMSLSVGDEVSIVMVMDDGVSALGQREGGWQGTFPISCLEIEDESGEMVSGDDALRNEVTTYSDLLITVSEMMAGINSGDIVPPSAEVLGTNRSDGWIHCGTPYVEFGLGMLKDVVQLGAETPQVSTNIAAGEVLLNQPYKAIQALMRLQEGSVSTGSISHSLKKHVALTLASTFLMIALANEDDTGEIAFFPDGTDRFAEKEKVDSKAVNNLLASIGVTSHVDINRISRSDVFPILQACLAETYNRPSNKGDQYNESAPVSPQDALAATILGTLEWITGVWIEDVDSEEALSWKSRGSRRIEEAVETQGVAVNILGLDQGVGGGIDGKRVGGDGGVFTVAAGLSILDTTVRQAAVLDARKGKRPLATYFDTFGSSEDAQMAVVGSGSPDLLIWSWAINNTRLQVCAKDAPIALDVAMHGERPFEGNVDRSGVEPFPCVHLRNEYDESMPWSSTDIALSDGLWSALAIPGRETETQGEQDPVSAAADKVMGAMVRRATVGRLKDLEKARLAESKAIRERIRDGRFGADVKRPLDSKPDLPAWMDANDAKALIDLAVPAGDDLGKLLKKLAASTLEDDFVGGDKRSEKEKEAGAGDMKKEPLPGLNKTQAGWINLFYKDAMAAVKNMSADEARADPLSGGDILH
ncbi:hypothetical protein HDU76_003509 [Blyttiomyces sp. JEL0837]|nr:hypothetical protein HDU76_003509 [Blyttiomyces sp. JEL0837]